MINRPNPRPSQAIWIEPAPGSGVIQGGGKSHKPLALAIGTGIGGDQRVPERRVSSVDKPTDLVAVDAASAAAIADAPFQADAIANREVSFMMLIDAGVPPDVANQLRRAYSLVWSFTWRPGADLTRRANTVSGLREEQSDWIAASISDTSQPEADGNDKPPPSPSPAQTDEHTTPAAEPTPSSNNDCPRCGDSLVIYSLGSMEQRACEACGFADVERQ